LDAGVANAGYLVGDDLTYADINVLPMLVTFGQFPQGKELLAKHPNLSASIVRLAARTSFTNTAAPPPRN
jgi:glutathione S-transferase